MLPERDAITSGLCAELRTELKAAAVIAADAQVQDGWPDPEKAFPAYPALAIIPARGLLEGHFPVRHGQTDITPVTTPAVKASKAFLAGVKSQVVVTAYTAGGAGNGLSIKIEAGTASGRKYTVKNGATVVATLDNAAWDSLPADNPANLVKFSAAVGADGDPDNCGYTALAGGADATTAPAVGISAIYHLGRYMVPVQLDVWTRNKPQRETIMAALNAFFCPQPSKQDGRYFALGTDYYSAKGWAHIRSTECIEDGARAQKSDWRSTIMIDAQAPILRAMTTTKCVSLKALHHIAPSAYDLNTEEGLAAFIAATPEEDITVF